MSKEKVNKKVKKKDEYIPDPGLKAALEVAMDMEIPLFITGDPGTGKTMLAYWLAQNEEYQEKYSIDPEVLRFNVKTTTIARDLLYQYDAIRHFRESTKGAGGNVNVLNFIRFRALGQSIISARTRRRIVLLDEIDKAPRDLPNDLLYEFEKLSFRIEEATKDEIDDKSIDWSAMFPVTESGATKPEFDDQLFIHYAPKEEGAGEKVKKPILILTSNSEKNLPDAFLRRCAFYHISFPEKREKLLEILTAKDLFDPKKEVQLVKDAVDFFLGIRKGAGLRKNPATAELIAWVELLHAIGISPLKELSTVEFDRLKPSLSLLGKNKEDLERITAQLKLKEEKSR